MLSRSARALAHRRPLSLAARSTPTLLRKTGVASLHSTRQLGASTSGNDAFASSTNSFYIDSMYEEYKKDPSSVHASWATYFKALDGGIRPQDAFQVPPSIDAIQGAAPV
ncbi:hypothetical protein JCM5353_000924, partial [Sporobolomyces roseus]